MPTTTFYTPTNGGSTKLTQAHALGDGLLRVAAAFGSSFPMRVSAGPCIFRVTGVSGGSFAVSGAIEGTSDAALPAGTLVQNRFTAGDLADVQGAVHALEVGVDGGVSLPASSDAAAPVGRLYDSTDAGRPAFNTGSQTVYMGTSGSGSDASFVFNQGSPAATWVVVHNLGKNPAVTVVDSTGSQVWGGDVHFDSQNQVTVTFGAAFSGKAFLN